MNPIYAIYDFYRVNETFVLPKRQVWGVATKFFDHIIEYGHIGIILRIGNMGLNPKKDPTKYQSSLNHGTRGLAGIVLVMSGACRSSEDARVEL